MTSFHILRIAFARFPWILEARSVVSWSFEGEGSGTRPHAVIIGLFFLALNLGVLPRRFVSKAD